MKLFYNRPLAFFCFIFIVISACLWKVDLKYKLIVSAVLAGLLLLCLFIVFVTRRSKKAHIRAVFTLVCVFSALIVPIVQIISSDIKRERALKYIGENYVSFTVVSEEYEGDYSSEYLVVTESVADDVEEFYSVMVCAFADAFDVGEKIYAKVEVHPLGQELLGYTRQPRENEYFQMVLYESSHFVVISENNRNAAILMNNVRKTCSEYIDRVFGDGDSGLVKGFLFGDKSDISTENLRDFRRSGVSHLLAVSGLHISVLIGSLAWLLKKIGVGRGIRSVILSIAALGLLAVTGFSMSACRSVIMLWLVYMSYLYVKENDSITTLFVAVALIMFFLPSSVTDIGLWLSFLATLGILCVWYPLSLKITAGNRSGIKGRAVYVLKRVFLLFLMTFICNSFICFVIWYYFGEVSVVSLISNTVLSPLSSLFMILALLACIFSFLSPMVTLTVFIGNVIVKIAGFFSEISGAVISLKYDFAGPIIILMSLSLGILLVIKLRKKWLILTPCVAAVAAFAICFGIYSYRHSDEVAVSYYSRAREELLILNNGYSAAICDISYGSYSFLYSSLDIAAQSHATEVSEYVLSHYHARHPAALEKMFRRAVVRRICLPYPEDSYDVGIFKNIYLLCEKYDVDVYVYDNGEKLDILNGAWCSVLKEKPREDEKHEALCFVVGNEKSTLSYISTGANDSGIETACESIVSKSNVVVFGKHGIKSDSRYSYDLASDVECVFYSDAELYKLSDILRGEYALCVAKEDEEYTLFRLTLD